MWPGHSQEINPLRLSFSSAPGGLAIPSYANAYKVPLPKIANQSPGLGDVGWTSAVVSARYISNSDVEPPDIFLRFFNAPGYHVALHTHFTFHENPGTGTRAERWVREFQGVLYQAHPFGDTLTVWTDISSIPSGDYSLDITVQLSQYKLGGFGTMSSGSQSS